LVDADTEGRIGMNSNKLDFVRRQLSARVHGNVPIRVRLRTYLEFSRRIDTGLSELVDR